MACPFPEELAETRHSVIRAQKCRGNPHSDVYKAARRRVVTSMEKEIWIYLLLEGATKVEV